MLPQGYIDTIRAYTEGTKRITTWLVQGAKRCGADVSFLNDSVSTTQSGDASSTAKTRKQNITKYEVPLREFPRLASDMASSSTPKIRLPKSIMVLLRNVIDLRQQASDVCAKRDEADEGHRHFISVLETVLEILEPAATSELKRDTALNGLSNMFEALKVEDTEEDDELVVPVETKSKKQQPSVEYELEVAPLDQTFAAFSFFRDLNTMRDYIKKVWRDYRGGRVSVMSAAVTTDTAWALLKESCDRIVQDHYAEGGYYQMMTLVFRSSDDAWDRSLRDWFCWDSFTILDTWSSLLQKNHNPVLKPGYSGSYDPTCDRESLSEGEKQHEDVLVLMELLPEIAKLSAGKVLVPAEDLLTAGLRKMMEVGSIEEGLPMYAIFAAQTLLDIHHVLRQDASRPFDNLQATGKRVVDTLDDFFQYHQNRKIGAWALEHDKVFRRISALAKDWALEDKLARILLEDAKDEEVPPFHLLKRHPVLAGLLTFRLNLHLHEAGLDLCLACGSVLYPIHLYNAARRSGRLQEPWDDAEFIIGVHSPSRVSVGAPPTQPADYEKRMLLALGGSVSNFASNRRGGPDRLIMSKKRVKSLKTTSPVREIFQDRYIRGTAAVLSVSNIVAMVAVASKAERVARPSIDMTAFAREMVTQKQFTSIQLLTAVREGVAGEELHLLFDYFSFHQHGYKLLRDLQTHLESSMSEIFEENCREDDSKLPYVVFDVFGLARGAEELSQLLREHREHHPGSRILSEAADVVRTKLKNENGRTLKAKAKAQVDATLYAAHDITSGQDSTVGFHGSSENS